MTKIILCNTYYQLIIALQLKITQFKNDSVYLILSDHSKNAEQIANTIDSLNIFEKVLFIRTKELDYSEFEIGNLYKDVLPAILGNCSFIQKVKLPKIDEFIYYNISFSTFQIFACLSKDNSDIICSRIEEGILSYDIKIHDGVDLGCRYKLINIVREFLGYRSIFKSTKNFYCFQPDFYKGILNPVEVSSVSFNGQMKDILSKSFDIKISESDYEEKYIFFTSVYDFEGGEPIGEYELVCKIAALVGKENLLIKTHPRDTRTIYEDNGFTVDKNSGVPWEAIQLSRDFSDKVFLTATSGSVLAGSFMSENPPKTFFMYKCCNNLDNKPAQKSVETIEALLNDGALKETLKTVAIANDVKDILI